MMGIACKAFNTRNQIKICVKMGKASFQFLFILISYCKKRKLCHPLVIISNQSEESIRTKERFTLKKLTINNKTSYLEHKITCLNRNQDFNNNNNWD